MRILSAPTVGRSAAELEQLWKEGLTLAEAVESFTTAPRMRRRKAPPDLPAATEFQDLSTADLLAATGEAAQAALAEWARASEPTIRRRAELVHRIAIGQFAAVAFLEGDPETYREVPPGLLHPRHFKWEKSRISGERRTYREVRIAPIPQSLPAPPTSNTQGGRPSARVEIREALEALRDEPDAAPDLLEQPGKHLQTLVLRHLGKDLKREHKGFGEETIRRVARELREGD